ncbi:sulfotransferase [Nocardioides humilatus]|uniref:Sulfotransferase n=1 Tax=Nocardioides humilatus TaxID=2607660 RepID=A0A5B1LN79_9ACTN|nr:sulfotransferase [Nocardioides humilatus]KAA1421220.1 sulfotransferase [Nocardioides humilatus]
MTTTSGAPATPGANSRAVLVACMPKSGSTFLSAALSNLPGYRREHVVPSYARREQELSEAEIQRAFGATQTLRRAFDQGLLVSPDRPRAWVAQNHVKHTHETQTLIDRYGIVPVCLVRNIYDILVSLRDHFVNDSPHTAAAYVDESMIGWEPERMYAFLVDMAVPWYLHFYVSWAKAEQKVLVTYEDLIADPHSELRRILKAGQLPWNNDGIADALEKASGGNVRKNVGTTGRGEVIGPDLRARVESYCNYYPDVDFGPIGIA